MPKINVPITEGFYESHSLPVNAQECKNWYVAPVLAGGLSQEVLYGTPGLSQLTSSGSGPYSFNRGIHVKNDIPYFVNGTTLYKLDRTIDDFGDDEFSLAALGTISGTGRVSMADNGSQLFILEPDGNGYIYDENSGTPFQQITDPDFTANGSPQYVVFLDGYFVITTDEKKFIVSSLNDGLSYNALDFGSAEADPDRIVRPIVLNNQLFILGSETTEVFRNVGGSGFPFQRVSGFIFDKGCSAPFSVEKSDSSFFMLGGGMNEFDSIWLFTGSGYQKISTPAIDNLIQSVRDIDRVNAFSWQYSQRGSFFLGISIGPHTIVYDLFSKKWHERSSVIDSQSGAFRANYIVSAYNRLLVGDTQDGRIGVLDTDVYTEYGSTICRVVSSPNLSVELSNTKVSMIEATVESGMGNDEVESPVMSMDYSDDGGKTFVYPRNRSIGKIGEYERRAVWRRNGAFPRFRILRFVLTDPVKPVLISVTAEVSR